ncbi:uncharacterized protein LOC122246127 [Penaeus japonicus]|uniref:uncharacterized protein LOC122246127 n=1 Tax=Penaeus japonicus TaxID=27405 RepID=UPI001C715299|nr:uncharacterized protein LOC122246127 [Penaeus japonicus]XP_042860386.1 uncharacterized protein LOC122246127 [Penaeus japonicus]XP_042860387.1 uncharacterized protein LOC122246127 [Penaeus japonicus]XP_042860388.1 uncharacterized protein LOC122246127 [Penaeus japonicus]XP_042860389.1 uncharacterized protein LOC122246127 [Penaeus japonicus]XP_042860390.1 uncharacterized protein LOC122246127 [Penaeus japonicus]XP_042860391.1 uncharacterized protein LOC122246127 [Penaeus japonicus]XP_04286039
MERLHRMELAALKTEEKVVRELMEKYKNTLIRLQVEELTIMHQLVGKQDQELKSRNATLVDADVDSSYQQVQTDEMLPVSVSEGPGPSEITMKELQINQSTLNLDAAPLIHRMLHDSEIYEEEEEEEEEETELQ